MGDSISQGLLPTRSSPISPDSRVLHGICGSGCHHFHGRGPENFSLVLLEYILKEPSFSEWSKVSFALGLFARERSLQFALQYLYEEPIFHCGVFDLGRER